MCYWENVFVFSFLNSGITEPLLSITFPYLTVLKVISCFPFILLAINNLSAHNFVAPYKFTGAAALSVDNATTFLTFSFNQQLIMFCAPIILVFINSVGLYSAAGTCFNAAA